MDNKLTEAEQHIVLLAEKMKQNQAHLEPNKALRQSLIVKMAQQNKPTRLLPYAYRIAASLLICLSICYFWQNKKDHIPIVAVAPTIAQKPEIVFPTVSNNVIIPSTSVLKKKSQYGKKFPKPKQKQTIQADYEDISLAFANKKKDFEWQDDEDEETHSPNLMCSDK